MLFIPVPFLTAAVFITALLVLRGGEKPSGFFTAFMLLCALQSLLIGSDTVTVWTR